MIKIRGLETQPASPTAPEVKPIFDPGTVAQPQRKPNGEVKFPQQELFGRNGKPVIDLVPDPGPKPEPPPASADVLHRQAKLAINLGATSAVITGRWVWAMFNGKPSNEVRAELKLNKWIWCKNKGKWAYRGAPSHSKRNMPWDYIKNKYGEEEIS